MTNSTSRRSIILKAATALVASTAAMPALAGIAPDAELLRLGAVFDEFKRQYDEAMIGWKPVEAFIEEELEKLGDGPDVTYEAVEAVWQRAYARFPDFTIPENVVADMDNPQLQIMAFPATTLAGLVVKAKVAKFGCENYWDKEWKDRDWDHMAATQLIDAVLALAGGQSHG